MKICLNLRCWSWFSSGRRLLLPLPKPGYLVLVQECWNNPQMPMKQQRMEYMNADSRIKFEELLIANGRSLRPIAQPWHRQINRLISGLASLQAFDLSDRRSLLKSQFHKPLSNLESVSQYLSHRQLVSGWPHSEFGRPSAQSRLTLHWYIRFTGWFWLWRWNSPLWRYYFVQGLKWLPEEEYSCSREPLRLPCQYSRQWLQW